MIVNPIRLVDPAPEAVNAALDVAFQRAEQLVAAHQLPVPSSPPGREDFLALLANEPNGGVYRWRWPTLQEDVFQRAGLICRQPDPQSIVVGVAWWVDALGRRLWLVEVAFAKQSSFYRTTSDPEYEPLIRGECQHPLEVICPTRVLGICERRGSRDVLLHCGCGLAGTPGRLAWVGSSCGPCADRQFDGEAPFERSVYLPGLVQCDSRRQLLIDAAGRLIDVRAEQASPGAASSAGGCGLITWGDIRAWPSPWTAEEPAWRERLPLGVVSCCGHSLAVLQPSGNLVLLDTADGKQREVRAEGAAERIWTVLAGPSNGVVVGASVGTEPVVCAWEGATGRRLYCHPGRFNCLAFSSDGRCIVLAAESGPIQVREAASGRLVERLRFPTRDWVRFVAVTPDGTILAAESAAQEGPGTLARWGPPPPPAPAGWLAGLLRASHSPLRKPDHWVRVEGGIDPFAVSPDGSLLLTRQPSTSGLVIYDVASLQWRVVFWARFRHFAEGGFTPDGNTLFLQTREGVLALPLAELLGE